MIVMIDEEFRRMANVKDYLYEFGFNVILIRDVNSALKYIEEHTQDIEAIILDI